MTALEAAKVPLGAYALLENLRGTGINAPMQVYRALRVLTSYGLAHRIETLDAYVASQSPQGHASFTAFAICDCCGQVEAFTDQALTHSLRDWMARTHFAAGESTIEVHGNCASCANESPNRSDR
ncbi:Fur family transcriptional regulator [Pseudomonas matsuisoli]|nr:transcriptional repressor [Pseudomonas matsuisoli]